MSNDTRIGDENIVFKDLIKIIPKFDKVEEIKSL
jgi:hypothetical protein